MSIAKLAKELRCVLCKRRVLDTIKNYTKKEHYAVTFQGAYCHECKDLIPKYILEEQ